MTCTIDVILVHGSRDCISFGMILLCHTAKSVNTMRFTSFSGLGRRKIAAAASSMTFHCNLRDLATGKTPARLARFASTKNSVSHQRASPLELETVRQDADAEVGAMSHSIEDGIAAEHTSSQDRSVWLNRRRTARLHRRRIRHRPQRPQSWRSGCM